MQEVKEFILLKSLYAGTLILYFDNPLAFGEQMSFVLGVREPEKRIRIDIAATMFMKTGTLSAYKSGLFTMDEKDYDKLYNYALERGLVYEDKKEIKPIGTQYTPAKMKEFLTLDRVKDIERIIKDGGKEQLTLLYNVATENVNNIKLNILRMIENAVGMEIDKGDE